MRSTLVLTVVTAGPLLHRRFVFHPAQRVLVGRTEASDLVFDHGSVHSRHAWIWCEDGQWLVQDVGSNAGTFVAEEAIYSLRAALPFGALLRLGGFSLRASEGAAGEAPSLPVQPAANAAPGVLLRDGVRWSASPEECEALALRLDVGSAPVLRQARQGGTVDLRQATGVELLALLGSIESERARSAFTPAVQELCRLLRSDPRVLSYPMGMPSANDALRIGNALALSTTEAVQRYFRTPHRPEWPALVLRAIARHPDWGPAWLSHFKGQMLPLLDGPEREAVTAMTAATVEPPPPAPGPGWLSLLAPAAARTAQPVLATAPRPAAPPSPIHLAAQQQHLAAERAAQAAQQSQLATAHATERARLAAAHSAEQTRLAAANAVRDERGRVEHRALRLRAEARLIEVDPSFRPAGPEPVGLPRLLDSACGFNSCSEVERLEAMERPSQKAIDAVAELLAGTIETHVLWALRWDGEEELGEPWSARGHSGLPSTTKRFLSRYRPSPAINQRLELAIAVISEALKIGIHFWGNNDDHGVDRVTGWFMLFHDLVRDLRPATG